MKKKLFTMCAAIVAYAGGFLPVRAETAELLFSSPDGTVEVAEYAAGGTVAVLGMADGRVLRADLEAGTFVELGDCMPSVPVSVTVNEDGSLVFWGDYAGTLYRWSEDKGTEMFPVCESALRVVRLVAGDSALGVVPGKGDEVRYYDSSSMELAASVPIGLEQVMAGGGRSADAFLVIGDHSGTARWVEWEGNRTSTSEWEADTEGITGMVFWGGEREKIASWGHSGQLRLWGDMGREYLGYRDLEGMHISSWSVEETGSALWLGTKEGGLYRLSLTLNEEPEAVGTVGSGPVVAIGKGPDTGWELMTASGARWRVSEAGVEPVTEPLWSGQAVRGSLRMRSGEIAVVTDRGEGSKWKMVNGAKESVAVQGLRLLDVAYLRLADGPHLGKLQLDGEGVLLSFASSSLPSWRPAGWTPTFMASAAHQPLLAVQSGNGRLLVLERDSASWVPYAEMEAAPGSLWRGPRFVEDDQWVIQSNGEEQRRLHLATGMVETVPVADTKVGLTVEAPDGPFAMEMGSAGSLRLRRDEGSAMVRAYPELAPVEDGGMATGYFGRILETRGNYCYHAVYGWGAVSPYAGGALHWFPAEGWLAAAPDWGSYAFSMTSNNWVMFLANEWETDWLYDFEGARWRRIGQ